MRETLRAAGFDEAQTPSFVDAATLATFELLDNLVEIKNPISQSQRFLRPYVFATLGSAVAYNLNRQASRVKLFEIGHAFDRSTEDQGVSLRERRRFDDGKPDLDYFWRLLAYVCRSTGPRPIRPSTISLT